MPAEQSASLPNPRRFTGYLADTRESRRIHYRIRYKVYCERKGFEDNALLRKRGLERDAFDGHALPFIFRDEQDGQWRGTARLIIRGSERLPLEITGALPADFCEGYPPGTIGEVSRLAALGPVSPQGQNRWTLLTTTLGTVLACAGQFGMTDLLFMITPGLARVVRTLGIPMTPVGAPVHHKGRRQGYVSPVADALASVRAIGARDAFGLYSELGGQEPVGMLA
ncbi:MAG: GNAT family N-acetyltransferase [Spiribacter salinus]|uniref:GNAT family N-acetyltransferase n=1 Tax=Spiribacter salinus TaxID=1335746 RepID=A0A540VN74_9GAMM|nr:MAG: GNAT family N-acetyltransferase [Spiribacter salinus]